MKYWQNVVPLIRLGVASFAEAWIEITCETGLLANPDKSPPSRRRGLKYNFQYDYVFLRNVASFAEAWIEILEPDDFVQNTCRLLRGGVD